MDKKKDNNIILTKSESLSMSGRMKITKSNNFNRNKNVIVVGGAGSGKTRFYVKPNLMQLHSSYVVSDSKGLLLSETATMFKEAGYEIKVFDLITRENTDFYNPFTYIRSEDDILKVVNNLIKNTSDPEKKGGDDFWEKAETALLMATFSYLLQEVDEEDQTLTNVVEMVRLANCPEDVPDYVSPLDVIFNELEEKDPANFAVAQYKIFKLAGDRTAKSILVSLGVRLSPFDIPNIKKIVSKDTLALDTVGDKKTIIYILLSDTDTSFNFLASMLYQQLFDSLVYKADNVYKGRLPHHVRCVLDEFANIGQIPDFEKVISVIRSREISVNVILQNISQLKNLYKDTWETIIGTSDVFLYLGGMELSTHEYISKLLGKKTIQHKNISITKGSNGNFSENYQKMGRNLLDVDEVANLSGTQAILKIRGIVPFISEKYDITKHKNYKKLGDVTPKNWYERNQSPKNEEENGLK
ncbi:type IV secretory system conjugative DNA transfer family protein [Enterococcus sp. DIV1271a]|nr:type IV secretory system conjugative DNA transfer family protein [Enterococcus sp. DIV1298c]MBO1301326.1 type IV secretory system conjugative DNA transfer family protein [Enterococcus sp. DIV1271a]